MAFNWQTFRTRTLTAAVFVAVMLGGLLWNHWSFFILFSVVHFGCWWEYLLLLEKIHRVNYHPYTKMGLMVAGFGWMLWFCGPVYHIAGYGLRENFSLPVSAAGFTLLVTGIVQSKKIASRSYLSALAGWIYISLSWGLLLHLRQVGMVTKGTLLFSDLGRFLPCLVIFSIWINDTMAYIVGSLIGKTPLSPISPKKTWEGTTGGILLAVLVCFIYTRLAGDNWHPVIITLIAAIAGTFGDLFESKLKRMAQVKDSGQIMPGHGGFLDRFDSLLFATPFVWLFVEVAAQLGF